MATQLQIRRGTSAQVAAFTGAEGEVVVNTTNDSIHVNDGSTAGGFELARVDGSNWSITNAISTTANITVAGNILLQTEGNELQFNTSSTPVNKIYTDDTYTSNGLTISADNGVALKSTNNYLLLDDTGTNEMVLNVDSGERMRVTSTGIDVTGTALAHEIEIGDGSGGGTSEILFSDNVSARGKILYDHSSNPETMLLQTTGTTAVSIDNSQNVSMPNGNLDVTGTVTADGLTVDGITSVSATNPKIQLFETDTTNLNTQLQNQAGDFLVSRLDDDAGSLTVHLSIDHSTGNVSIPSGDLDVTGTATLDGLTVDGSATIQASSSPAIIVKDTTNNAEARLQAFNSTATVGTQSNHSFSIETNDTDRALFATNGDISFYEDTGTTPKMVWSSSAESLGIGVSSPSTRLEVGGGGGSETIKVSAGAGWADVRLHSDATNGGSIYFNDGADAGQLFYYHVDDTMRFHTATEEAMRISGGNLLVGTTTSAMTAGGVRLKNGGGNLGEIALSNNSGSADYVARFLWGSSPTLVGNITVSASATAYNTSSDQRLKENIADADDAGSKVDAIQVRQFDWKADGSHQDYGMVAQELVTVAPEAVSAPEDPEEMMGVDYSKLVPMLVKEIQSLRARVAQLEN